MGVMRALWASVRGNPSFMRRLNGWLTIFWIAMIPVSLLAGWLSSVTYVSALSLWALVSGHWSTWQAARVEVTQQREAEERESNPIEDKIVDKLIERTEIEPNGQTMQAPRRPTSAAVESGQLGVDQSTEAVYDALCRVVRAGEVTYTANVTAALREAGHPDLDEGSMPRLLESLVDAGRVTVVLVRQRDASEAQPAYGLPENNM